VFARLNPDAFEGCFRQWITSLVENFKDHHHDSAENTNGNHGRVETRKAWVLWDLESLSPVFGEWPSLKSIVMIEQTRQVSGGDASTEAHYYISSLDGRRSARQFLNYVRGH